jgi:hypothetical protein
LPPVEPGDRVDVLVTVGDAPTVTVASRAVVVDVTEDAVTVAVPTDRAPRVAFGAVAGAVTLALRGP